MNRSLLLERMGLLIKWVFANTRLFIEILLVVALLIAGWMYRRQERALADAKTQYGKLADDFKSQLTAKEGEIQILIRKNGKVESHTIFVPGEGGFIVVTTTVAVEGLSVIPPGYHIDMGDGTIVFIKDKGLCFKPGVGFEYGSKGLQARIDAKVAYWKRYSGLVGGSKYGIGIGVSRHLDDVFWFKPRGIEVFGSYNIIRTLDLAPFTIGIRINL